MGITLIKLRRKLILDNTGLRICLERDFIEYYRWLILQYYHNCIKIATPRHGAHIAIVTKALHKKEFCLDQLAKYHNMEVDFEYSLDMKIGGSYFTNFWLPVNFPLGAEIKNDLEIQETNFLGFHITVANTKQYEKKT